MRYETPPFYSVAGYNTSLSRTNLTILGAHATQVSEATVTRVLRPPSRARAEAAYDASGDGKDPPARKKSKTLTRGERLEMIRLYDLPSDNVDSMTLQELADRFEV